MPLPIAHSAAGLAAYLAFRKDLRGMTTREELFLAGSCIILANLPDLDFLPGFLVGQANRFHHGVTHSILFALVTGIVCYLLTAPALKEIPRTRVLTSCLAAILSHIVLDYGSLDRSEPYGIPLFWPFSGKYYLLPHPLFGDVIRSRGGNPLQFVISLFNLNNIREALIEIFFSGIVLSAVISWKLRSRPTSMAPACALFLVCTLLYYITLRHFVFQ
jgi:inner membrane protein